MWKTFYFTIYNKSWYSTYEYSIRLLKNADFYWKGVTEFKGILEPFVEHRVEVCAGFREKGVYNLNRWLLSLGNKNLHPEASFLFKINS